MLAKINPKMSKKRDNKREEKRRNKLFKLKRKKMRLKNPNSKKKQIPVNLVRL